MAVIVNSNTDLMGVWNLGHRNTEDHQQAAPFACAHVGVCAECA